MAHLEFRQSYTQYVWQRPLTFATFNILSHESNKKKATRGPASAVPRDDMEAMPLESGMWLSSVWVEDRAGVMNGMAHQLQEWERMEEYRRNWDIESTTLYNTPDREQKKAWFNRMLLRYADKRLGGELRNAEEGSTLQRIRTAKAALRPDTEASISENVKIKFKARVLQLRGIMRIINPWVESETSFDVQGRIHSRLAKNFEDLGIRTEVNYWVHEDFYNATISKPLGNNVTAVLSSAQGPNEIAFADMDRNTLQLVYSTAF
jgi:hypothetical protein